MLQVFVMFRLDVVESRVSGRGRVSMRDQPWGVVGLEPRLMLAADAGAAVEVAASSATSSCVANATDDGPTGQCESQRVDLVFVDSAVDNLDHLVGGLADGHELVLLNAHQNGLQQITDSLAGRTNVNSIHIVAHGRSGQLQLGDVRVDQTIVDSYQQQIQSWSNALTADADILLYGCETAAGDVGLEFVWRLAELTGADVAASTDKTGNASEGADWDLERATGVIQSGLAFDLSTRTEYDSIMPISIRAAGETGQEQMQLQIDGVTVATYDNVGGNAENREFETFTFDIDGVSADDVRVAFTNDAYDPATGWDRNLYVDSITIDGVRFETEEDNVYSTGAWVSQVGFVDGYQSTERLAGKGYFQYAQGDGPPPQSGAFAVINEIHYNPGPDGEVDGDAEFLELFNPGDQDFDLSGASFTGFDLTFAAGTTLAAGQYAIVAPSISIAESQWGVTPIAQFADGGLSGKGETITLIAADGVTVIDQVAYDDTSPWPGGPDGNGPSLELINPSLDNNDAASWGTSRGAPTPGAQNSVFSDGDVSEVTNITLTPGRPVAGEAFTVSATIADATYATLTYKVMFGEDQTVQMTNVGGDVWQAVVPGQDAGALVRYRIDSDVATAPFEGDTINYLGVVVADPDVDQNSLPVIQWFVDPDQFEELVTDLSDTNTKIPTVIAVGDQVIDNAEVRVRGNASRQYDKKGFKIELPKGYELDFGDLANGPVDEFGLVTDFADWSVTSAQISWEIFNAETESQTSSFFTRVEQNGDFYGVYRFQELYDGTWRDANGFGDGGEFYQAEDGGFHSLIGFDKKEPDDEDMTNIFAVRDIVNSEPSQAKTDWIYNNVDVPATINHLALSALTRHRDQEFHNFYVARDADTGRWSLVEWDLDLTWRDVYVYGAGLTLTTPEAIGNAFMDSIWEVPEFQEMYWQRLQTLIDTYLTTDYLIQRRAELVAEIGENNSDLEVAKWGRDNIFRSNHFVDDWQQNIDRRRSVFAQESRLPFSSVDSPKIVINELHYNPEGDDAEFLELYNDSDQAVDLSRWSVDGVDLTIAPGTVILPGGYMTFTDDDVQFRQQTEGNILVAGQYDGGLSGGGETITLLDVNGNVVDQVSYDDAAPWPVEADGDGFSLALRDPSWDNSNAGSWAASDQLGGTPGAANDLAPTTSISIFAAGSTATEIIQLEIAGQVVATYDLGEHGTVIGDYANRNFVELVYESNVAFAASDVRVKFINDQYDPANGWDANVRIDRIEIDSEVFQTEAYSVFSTGTWIDGLGIHPGFWFTEELHANGYFQFDAYNFVA